MANENGEQSSPIVLKVLRRKVSNPDGTVSMGTQIVDKETGRQVAGLIGVGDIQFGGMRYLEIRVTAFEEETQDSTIALPQDIIIPGR